MSFRLYHCILLKVVFAKSAQFSEIFNITRIVKYSSYRPSLVFFSYSLLTQSVKSIIKFFLLVSLKTHTNKWTVFHSRFLFLLLFCAIQLQFVVGSSNDQISAWRSVVMANFILVWIVTGQVVNITICKIFVTEPSYHL